MKLVSQVVVSDSTAAFVRKYTTARQPLSLVGSLLRFPLHLCRDFETAFPFPLCMFNSYIVAVDSFRRKISIDVTLYFCYASYAPNTQN